MKLKYRFLKIFLLITALGFLMNFAIKRHNSRDIDKVIIHIENSDHIHFITSEMIREVIDKTSSNKKMAKKIDDINIIQTEKELNLSLFITHSNVYIDLEGTVNVMVGQKIPIARIKNKKDEFYLDKDGNKFPLSSNFSVPCMMVGGNVNPNEFKQLARLCKLISVDKMLKNHIIAIEKDKENSYNLLLNVEGVYIEYGTPDNNLQKLTNLKEFYKQYLDYIGFEAYKKISLKYNNQIVATKR